MDKKELLRLGIVYVFVFLLALYMDFQGGTLEKGNIIYRNESGEKSKEVELMLDVADVFQNHEVILEIEPRRMTKEEAEKCFSQAIAEIEKTYSAVENKVYLQEVYVDGLVKAEWKFLPHGIIGLDGTIQKDSVPEEGKLLTVTVVLQCDSYEKVYSFPFRVEKPQMSLREEVEEELSEWVEMQQLQEGTEVFQLPVELAGIATSWKEKKEYFSYKILFLEGLSVILLLFARSKEQKASLKRCLEQREMKYPEIVNQLLILMEAGMTVRQAWHKIACQYTEKKKQALIEESDVYEGLVQMDRRLAEGENERTAYENFGNQMNVMCYRKLMRLLVHNLEKGSHDICQHLSLEAKQAYDQRILLAKRLGEEASTKMLIPMMLMMVLVMVIVMAPAILSFSV